MIKTFAQLKKIAATSLTLAAILLSNTAVAEAKPIYTLYPTTQTEGASVSVNGVVTAIDKYRPAVPVDESFYFCENALACKTNEVSYLTAVAPIGMRFVGWYGYGKTGLSSVQPNPKDFTKLISSNQSEKLTTLGTAPSYSGINLLQLKFAIADYLVDFDACGGTEHQAAFTVQYHGTYPEMQDATRTGYAFGGWFTEPDGGTCIREGDTVTAELAHDQTLYAHWTAEKYEVTFDPGSGTVSEPTRIVTYGEPYGELPIPTQIGYRFVGWTHNGNPVSAEDVFLSPFDITLKAQWEAINYRIALHSNYQGRHAEESVYVRFAPDGSDKITIYPAADYDFGYKELKFLGWDYDPDVETPELPKEFSKLGNYFYKQLKEGETDVHLYAIWKVLTYTVQFDADATDATGTMTDQVIERETATKLTKNAFARTGYTFKRWACEALGKTFADEEAVTNLAAVDETVTLVAVWEAIKQKVSFDANWDGPAGSLVTRDVPEPIELKFGETKSIPAWTPVNTLAEFRGWAYEADATEPDFTTEVKDLPAEAAITLYAVWAKKDSTLSQAVGCDNLILSSVEKTVSSHVGRVWSVCAEGGIESGVIKANVYTLRNIEQAFTELTATLPTPGTLVFTWHVRSATGGVGSFEAGGVRSATAATESNRVVYTNTSEVPVAVRWCAWGVMPSAPQYEVPSNLVITSVRWYPAGVNPEPTEEDAPVITADYSFKTDSMFDYVIEAKDALTDEKWTKVSVVTGDGSAIPLPMTPSAEQPQRFFRVRVIRRGTE